VFTAPLLSNDRGADRIENTQFPVVTFLLRAYLTKLLAVDRGFGVRSPAGEGQNGSGPLPDAYPVGTSDLSLGVKWQGREADQFTSV
jgi:hypothetical protein